MNTYGAAVVVALIALASPWTGAGGSGAYAAHRIAGVSGYVPHLISTNATDAFSRRDDRQPPQAALQLTAATEPTPGTRHTVAGRYAGTWVAQVIGGSIGLELQQPDARRVTGRMMALGGVKFELEGAITPAGGIEGIARGAQDGLFFAGTLTPAGLQIVIAEPDASGRANTATAKQLLFARSDSASTSRTPGPVASAPAAPSQNHLRGIYCSHSGASGPGGSLSRTTRACFDGIGQFQHSYEAYSIGDAGRYFRREGNPGNKGQYRVQVNQVALIFSDGSSGVAQVYERKRDGAITALQYQRIIYARVLCD